MFRQRRIASEQSLSLAKELQAYNIRNGDIVHDVEMQGVGFRTVEPETGNFLVLAFCPMHIVSFGDFFPATRSKRLLPFPSDILWTGDAMQALNRTTPHGRGFVNLKCTVASNDAIHLSNLRVLSVKDAPPDFEVNQPGVYYIFRHRFPDQIC